MTRWKSCAIVMFGLVVGTTLAVSAAERASSGGAQWPNLSQEEDAKWPNLRLDDIEAPSVNKHPSFVDPQEVEDRHHEAKASRRGQAQHGGQAERGIEANPSAEFRACQRSQPVSHERWIRLFQ